MSSRTYNVETFTFNNNIAAQSMGTAIFVVLRSNFCRWKHHTG